MRGVSATSPCRNAVRSRRSALDSEEALAAAKSQADAGTAFSAIAEAQGLSPADIDLGLKTRAEIIDQKVAEAAFAGAEGDVIAVADGVLGPALIRVAAVEAGGTTPLAELSGRLRTELAERTADERIVALYDSIEDERAAGGTMAEVAARVGVPHQTIPAVARDGSVPQGDAPVDLPGRDAVLADAFDSDVGIENDPVRTGDGGYVFYEVMEVIPARDRTLDEARDAVAAAWRAAETAERIAARADELFQRLQGGASMDEIATSLGRNVVRADNVTRGSQPPAGFSRNALTQAFAGPEGHIANAEADAPPARILVKVEGVSAPAFFAEADTARAVQAELASALQRDMLATYNSQLLQSARYLGQQRHIRAGHRLQPEPLMLVEPGPEPFEAVYSKDEPQFVWTRLVADLETPVSAFLKLFRIARQHVPSGIGGRRRRARPLLHDRTRSGPSVPRRRRRPGYRAPSRPVALYARRRRHHRGAARAFWRRAGSPCPTDCRRCRPASSAFSATTRCG